MATYSVEGTSEWNDGKKFNVTITGIHRKDVEKLTTLANRIVIGEEEPVVTRVYPLLANMDLTQKEGLIIAAKLYFENIAGSNILNTIKFIRALTNMGLKDSKDVVDYACGVGYKVTPDWLKDAA
jgi:ribosomal protein L7/L12